MGERWARLCALAGSLIVVIGTATWGGLAASAAAARPAAASASAAKASAGVKPHSTGMMDCNGHSPKYHDVKVDLGGGCTDPRGNWGGPFEDNGVYVGHDEPSVKFISSAPGSGNNMTYVMRLPGDPEGQADRFPAWQDGERLRGTQPGSVVRPADL